MTSGWSMKLMIPWEDPGKELRLRRRQITRLDPASRTVNPLKRRPGNTLR
jgi:hypothetical protein